MKKKDWQSKNHYHGSHNKPRKEKKQRTPPKPPIDSEIIDARGHVVYYDPQRKDICAPNVTGAISRFYSRTQARKALWHILQNPLNLANAPYRVQEWFPF